MNRRLLAWLPSLLWAALIFVLSSQERLPVDLTHGTDKIAHFLAYAVFGACLALGQTASGLPPRVALALGMLYGLSDEWHQSFVPGRSPDIRDWVADAAGVTVGVFIFNWWQRRGWPTSAPRSSTREHPHST